MTGSNGVHSPTTFFLSPHRADRHQLQASVEKIRQNPLIQSMLETNPGPGLVLNEQRQIVAANSRMLELVGATSPQALIGKRPGEALQCIHAAESPGGCGTSEACTTCGAARALFRTTEDGSVATEECRISSIQSASGSFDLEVIAHRIEVEGELLIVCATRDISGEKRRRVLERLFFHDVINTAGGIQGLALLLAEMTEGVEGAEHEISTDLVEASRMLLDEIQDQRELAAAETGELSVQPERIAIQTIVGEVTDIMRNHSVAVGRLIGIAAIPDIDLLVDRVLLRRVLVNLVKNALEATPYGGSVRVGAREDRDCVTFTVYNPTAMPREVQLQVFQRSFSTKGGSGRGIGTYSVKLIGESYLQGQISFTSEESIGTTFRFTLPREYNHLLAEKA